PSIGVLEVRVAPLRRAALEAIRLRHGEHELVARARHREQGVLARVHTPEHVAVDGETLVEREKELVAHLAGVRLHDGERRFVGEEEREADVDCRGEDEAGTDDEKNVDDALRMRLGREGGRMKKVVVVVRSSGSYSWWWW